MGAILDMNVIMGIAHGNREIFGKVLNLDSTFYITSITKFEILIGFPKKDDLIWLNSLINSKSAEIAAYLYKNSKKKNP
ncbi:PIN domain-containing protein [Pyrococcus abyssi]|nr:hypothetical protein [Pyrococcus abyssi]CCE70633.1 TPA: nucleic acid-binding protein [Pyrococcus abyssi GE5]